ncbi:oligopeptide/dipeptide ABC transporter ATP-binding protein [Candidatus Similichlamydia epinepheli]|uniref:oligopeptide/dipeptide ABC transporter ATP-binding protein n=1 Tax=Candidatus Similichlamydia epinepheli TaxID=1903953 RepID=UPI003B969C48
MYGGSLVEVGDVETVYKSPKHPYTKVLIDAIPIPDPIRQRQRVPKIIIPKKNLERKVSKDGCVFAPPLN